jgi:hypothetical protein
MTDETVTISVSELRELQERAAYYETRAEAWERWHYFESMEMLSR